MEVDVLVVGVPVYTAVDSMVVFLLIVVSPGLVLVLDFILASELLAFVVVVVVVVASGFVVIDDWVTELEY